MKLKNKKTGEIGYPYFQNWKDISCVIVDENGIQIAKYTSLAELNEEWEDYEGPKVGYIIDPMEEDYMSADDSGYEESDVERAKELGIWLETKEEAEKAVEKLKAIKRLKDKGIRFDNFIRAAIYFNLNEEQIQNKSILTDLDLLFGGEE